MDYNGLLELVKARRSIRKLKSDPIPDECVDKIIEVARWAPSGGNSQPWHFIVVKDKEKKKKIVQYLTEYNTLMRGLETLREPKQAFKWVAPGFFDAPVFIVVCGDTRLKESYPLNKTLTPKGDEIFISTLANAFLYMTLAVTTLGLGGEWISATGTAYVEAFIKNLLGIPKEFHVYETLAIGYPDTKPVPRPVKTKEEITHTDRFDMSKYLTEKQVKESIIKYSRFAEI